MTFEYKFVLIGTKWALLRRKPADDYRAIVAEHARNGWRLVQIFAPPVGPYGRACYFELIFERSR